MLVVFSLHSVMVTGVDTVGFSTLVQRCPARTRGSQTGFSAHRRRIELAGRSLSLAVHHFDDPDGRVRRGV